MDDFEPFVKSRAGNTLFVGMGSVNEFLDLVFDFVEVLEDIWVHFVWRRTNRVGSLNPESES